MAAPEMTETEIAELVYESFDGDAVVEEVIGEVDEVDEPFLKHRRISIYHGISSITPAEQCC